MRAWQVQALGELSGVRLAEIPRPVAERGQVLIRNRAAALNFFDVLQIQGKYQIKPPLPFTPGAEVAGTIEAVGPAVSGLAAGDRVLAIVPLGGFAEYAVAAAESVFRIPAAMSFAEAAAMPIVYQTSYFALTRRAALQAGEWLLVHAGAGGVGCAAVQIGKAMGARVIATAGSEDKLAFCRAQGAGHALLYNDATWVDRVREITGGRGVDVIYDPVGGDVTTLSLKCLAWEGRLLIIGFAGGDIPKIEANRLLLKNISAVGLYWGDYRKHNPALIPQAQQELFAMYDAGKIRPIVSQAYPFESLVAGLEALGSRRTHAKVVLILE
jgi:NADPH2:quinone reductase